MKTQISVVVEGRAKVQQLMNYLMKESNAHFPPTIISHAPFVMSTVKKLGIRVAQDTLVIEGVILPSHRLGIHRVIRDIMRKRAQSEYETEIVTEKYTKALNSDKIAGPIEVELPSETSDMHFDLDDWLAAKPVTVKTIRWKDGLYLL